MNFVQALDHLCDALFEHCSEPAVYTSSHGNKPIRVIVEAIPRNSTILSIDSSITATSVSFLVHKDDLWAEYEPQHGDRIDYKNREYFITKSLQGLPHFEYAESTRTIYRIFAKPVTY